MNQHVVHVWVRCDVGHPAHCAVPTSTWFGPRAAPQPLQCVGWGSDHPWWVRRNSMVRNRTCVRMCMRCRVPEFTVGGNFVEQRVGNRDPRNGVDLENRAACARQSGRAVRGFAAPTGAVFRLGADELAICWRGDGQQLVGACDGAPPVRLRPSNGLCETLLVEVEVLFEFVAHLGGDGAAAGFHSA